MMMMTTRRREKTTTRGSKTARRNTSAQKRRGGGGTSFLRSRWSHQTTEASLEQEESLMRHFHHFCEGNFKVFRGENTLVRAHMSTTTQETPGSKKKTATTTTERLAKEWLSAGFGCALSDTMFNPLEVLKVRRQIQASSNTSTKAPPIILRLLSGSLIPWSLPKNRSLALRWIKWML